MSGQGKLLGVSFELARGVQYALDDAAYPAAEILDELIKLGLAALHCKPVRVDAFSLELLAFDAVILENADGPGNRTNFVVAIGVLNFDVRLSSREKSQGFGHGLQWLGDASDHQHRDP